MLLRPVTPEEMRTGSVVSGIAMALFIVAPRMGRAGRSLRLVVMVAYLAALVGFLIFSVMT